MNAVSCSHFISIIMKGKCMTSGNAAAKSRWYQILTGFLSLATLGTNLMMFGTLFANFKKDPSEIAQAEELLDFNIDGCARIVAVLLLLVALLHLLECIVCFRESRLLLFRHLIYIILSLYVAVLMLMPGDAAAVCPQACFLYLTAAFTGSVISLIHKRSKWNVLLLVLMLVVLLLGAGGLLIGQDPDLAEMGLSELGSVYSLTILFFLIDVQCVATIVPIAFSSVRMDILKKIIRKTYAVEILFGIFLLIVAFSLILPAFEPGIDNFGDGLWYCFAIVTTIGFGDIAASSVVGRIMSVILGIYGIIVVSLITSIIVNFYGEMKKEDDE